jgi:hypothetical protein
MKRVITSKKGIALLATLVVAAAAAVGAYAYFSSTGAGSGSAAVGNSSTIILSSDPVGNLFPGGPSIPVTVHVVNPGGGNEQVNTITGAVQDNGGCLGSWFTVAPINYNQDLSPGAGPDASTTVTLNDIHAPQDACQGATMTINWSSN